ncbi:hypothetical protein MD484_g6847, partial [Candolleomyces efflorescens]
MSERNDPTSDSVSQGFKKQRTDTMGNTAVEADTRLSELPMDIFSEQCGAHEEAATVSRPSVTFLRMELHTRLCHPCFSPRYKLWEDLPEKPLTSLVYPTPSPALALGLPKLYDVDTALALHVQYEELNSSVEKEDWLKYQTKIRDSAVEHAKACRRFVKKELAREQRSLKQLQRKRRQQVVEKLKVLGWAKELDFIGGIGSLDQYWEPILSVPEELDNQDWNELQPKLLARLHLARSDLLKQENEANIRKRIELWLIPAYDSFVASRPLQHCLPSLLDVSFTPEFRSAMSSMPLSEPLSQELSEVLAARLSSYAEEWKRERDNELLSLVLRALPHAYQDISVDILCFASTIFGCEACHELLTYPSVISHRCNFVSRFGIKIGAPGVAGGLKNLSTKPYVRIVEVENDLARYIGDAVRLLRPGAVIWGGFGQIVFDTARHEHMINMLSALQWSRTTLLTDMESKDPYVDCLCQCFYRMRGKWSGSTISLNWKEAIEICTHHRVKKRSGPQFFARSQFSGTEDIVPATGEE